MCIKWCGYADNAGVAFPDPTEIAGTTEKSIGETLFDGFRGYMFDITDSTADMIDLFRIRIESKDMIPFFRK